MLEVKSFMSNGDAFLFKILFSQIFKNTFTESLCNKTTFCFLTRMNMGRCRF